MTIRLGKSLAAMAVLAVSGLAPVHAGIYKWIDEDGVVQYTQQPPTTGKATEIRPAPPPADDPQAVRQRLERQLEEFNQRREARIQGDSEAAQAQAEQSEMSDFCAKVRENLAVANTSNRVMERTADGNLVPLTPEQLEQKKQLLQNQIDTMCQ